MTKLRRITLLLVCILLAGCIPCTARADERPKILDCTEGTIYAAAGETVTLFVEADSNGKTFEWRALSNHTLPENDSRYTSTYTFTMTPELHNLCIWCKVSYEWWCYEFSSVVYVKLPELQITKQPEGAELVTGQEAQTSVAAIGDHVTYQWYSSYKGADYSPLSCTSSDFSAKLTEPGDYQIYCQVTDRSGQTLNSNPAYFTIYAPVYIKTDVTDSKTRVGADVHFTFQAEGCSVAYQWYYKAPNASDFSPLSGTTGTSCTFTMDSATKGSKVYCIATDTAGNIVRSKIATALLDASLSIDGNCTNCGGDGVCDRCGGDMWYTIYEYIYGSNGFPYLELVTKMCDAVYCTGGYCGKCGGDGWIGEETTAGDADSNGTVNTRDALRVLQYAAGWNVTIDEHSADVNNNNVIEPYDAVLILQNIASN